MSTTLREDHITINTAEGSPTISLDKDATGTASVNLKAAGVLRGQIVLDASENLVLKVFDTDGTTVKSSLQLNQAGGTTQVGSEVYLTLDIANLVAADAKVYGINCPVAGTITRIASRLNGAALAAGDATITGKIGAVAITDGAITITQAGSAQGDLDSVAPSAANTVAVGSDLNFTVGGANTDTAAFATLTITIRRTA